MFDLKKERSKIRKILLRTLLLLVFFSSILAVLTRNKWVQTQLAQYIAAQFQDNIGIELEIKAVEIDFLRNFHIEGILVRDLHRDTLISIRVLDAQLQNWNLKKNEFKIGDFELFYPFVKMGKYDSDSLLNYEEILAKLPKDTANSRPLQIALDGIKINNGSYVFFDGEESFKNNVLGEFNPSYLRYDDIESQIELGHVNYDGTLDFEIESFSALDRTGYKIDEISGPLKIDGPNLSISKLKIKTGKTFLNGNFSIQKDPKIKGSYFESFVYKLDLVNSSIRLSDIGAYAPYLKNHSLELELNAEMEGPLADFKVNRFLAKTKNGSNLNLNYTMKGMPNLPQLIQTVEFKESFISKDDIQEMFQVETWNDNLSPFGDIYLNLNCEIPRGLYKQTGSVRSQSGTFDGFFEVDYAQMDSVMPFLCRGDFNGLKSTIWSDSVSAIDRISGSLNLQGNRFDSAITSSFELINASAYLNGNFINNIDLIGTTVNGDLDVQVAALNDKIRLNLDFDVSNYFKPNREVNLVGKISKFDLFGLGLDTVRNIVSGEIDLDLQGTAIDNYTGSLSVDYARFERDKTEFQLQHQIITRPDSTLLGFKGDWLDGSITGPLKLSNTALWLKQIANSIAPERFLEVKEKLNDSIYLELTVPQTAWIEEFVVPGLYLGPLRIQGHYFANQNTFDLSMGPFSLEYGRMYMEKVYFSMEKPRKNGLVKSQFRTNYILVENTLYDTFGVSMEVLNGGYQIATRLHDKSDRYLFSLKGNGAIHAKSSNLYFKETQLKILNQFWNLDREARISFLPEKWEVSNFFLADADHFLEIAGDISTSEKDTLHIDFGNFTPKVLAPFFPRNTFDSLRFRSNGSVALCAVRGDIQFFGNLGLNKVVYMNEPYGSANIAVKQTQAQGRVRVEADVRSGPLSNTTFAGDLLFEKGRVPQINILGNIPNGSHLDFLKPFLAGIINIENGTFGADLRISGDLDKPKTQGLLRTNQFKVGIDYLGTQYKVGGNFKITDEGLFTFRPQKFTDPTTGNFAWMQLAITHDNFKDFAIDLKLDSIKNMRVLATTESMNNQFYGNAWADGSAHIFGLFSEIDMDIDLTTREKTKLAIQYPEVGENRVGGSIVFMNKKIENLKSKTDKGKGLNEPDAIGQINLNITATPVAEVQFVIDKRLGDIIKGYGDGGIRLVYGRDEKLYLYGRYVIDKGEYAFSLPGVNLLKKITVNKGGSIRWEGDPYNAEVDLSGSFEKKISPSTLMVMSSSSGASYPTTTFVSILSMKGNLFSPSISFDLQAPDLSSITGATGSEINSVLQRIRANKDETMRQSISLLLFGNFLPPSLTGASAPTTSSFSSAGFAGNSISTLASSVVNDLFSKYGIPTRIQVNIDDVRNATGNSNTQLFVNSEWFLSERLRLDLNYDPTVAVLVNSVAVPLNFNLEYKTRDENWRLKAFSRSNNLILQQNSATTTNGVSGNTLGTGVLYRREFDTFKRTKK